MSNPNPTPIAKRGPGHKLSSGFQDPGPRGRFLAEKYGVQQIQDWYKLVLANDGSAKAIPLSTPDIMLLGRIARSFKDDAALDKFYDRSFGKVPDRNINLNINADVDPEKLSEQAAEMLARLRD